MDWQHPEALYLIVPLSALWLGLSIFARLRRRRAAEAFVAAAMWPRVLPPDSPERFWIKTALWELALILGLVALAGPRFGAYYEEIRPRGSDLYVLIDVSRSMLADDVPPSRLGRAKADVSTLLNRLKGERVGLIAFAGKAVVKCPLTTDYDFYRRSLEELDPNSAPRGGTAIGDAVRKALEVFPAEADRDQAILLITDGDDQESYPLDAAALAAERHVTIFSVGLGDAEQGARIPSAKDVKNFMEYEGKQVWSKLNNSVLKDIALKTNGVFVPAGTRAYDLGLLYDTYLKGRRGADGKEQKRLRLSEQFQIFLGLAILMLLGEILVRPYPPLEVDAARPGPASVPRRKALAGSAALVLVLLPLRAIGGEPHASVKEGIELYAKDKFEEAREKFAAASEKLGKDESEKAAIIAFDLACAYHRKGDTEHARDEYLKAGLARDAKLASEAHFNLGQLSAEAARTLAGEHPEAIEPDKRKEITDKLLEAAASFRESLKRRPANEGARKNIELVRQWLKVYADKWREMDRQKMRDQTNLAQFVEFLVKTENALRDEVKRLKPTATRDMFAERKRVQDELLEEIPVVKEKIVKEVTPPPQQAPQPGTVQPQPAQPQPQMDPKQVEEAIKLLQGWAEDAGKKMDGASNKLRAREPVPAAADQKNAVAELEKIWEAVIPFHPLLARDLDDQTKIVHTLRPELSDEDSKDEKSKDDKKETPKEKPFPLMNPLATLTDEQLAEVIESQENTLRRTAYLKPKAEAELERVNQMPPQPQPAAPPPDPKDPKAKKNAPPDPEKIKEGYKKAIELAPKAVEKMAKALQSLRDKKTDAAYPDAEEARRILEEIMKAQPKDENQDKNQDQDKKNQDQKDQDKKDQDKKDQEKKDQEKKDQDKKDEKDKDRKDEQKDQKQEKDEKKDLSQDKIEDALRKVLEREKQKRDRDKEMKTRIYGQMPVDKDW